MSDLRRAVELTEKIRGALAEEVERAREQRILIRTMNADALFLRAQARADFNVKLAEMERDLALALDAAGGALGLREITLEALRARAPGDGESLTATFAEVRALAGALHELDTLNRELAERALGFVRGYVNAVAGPPAAYDRRGAAAAGPPLSTARRVA